MLTKTTPLISLTQLEKRPGTYRELVRAISSLPYPIGEMPIATSCEAIGKVLSKVYVDLGSKVDIDEDIITELIDFIRYQYGSLHPVEIQLAYEMVFSGEIKIEFIGTGLVKKNLAKVLNRYIEYKSKATELVPTKKENKQMLTLSPEQLRKNYIVFLETIVTFYNNFLEKKHESMMYMTGATYDIFLKHELIDDKDKDELYEQAKAIYISRHKSERNHGPIPTGEYLDDKVKGVYKELKVLKAFQEMEFQEFDLRGHLMSRVR